MDSILEQLDRLGHEHPHKVLYSYLDLNGNPLESYTYASFLHRTKAIASHLLKDGGFAAGDREPRAGAGPGGTAAQSAAARGVRGVQPNGQVCHGA